MFEIQQGDWWVAASVCMLARMLHSMREQRCICLTALPSAAYGAGWVCCRLRAGRSCNRDVFRVCMVRVGHCSTKSVHLGIILKVLHAQAEVCSF